MTVNQSCLNTRRASLTTPSLKAPLRPVTPRHTSTVSRHPVPPLLSPFLLFLSRAIFECFVCVKYSRGQSDCRHRDGQMERWMDGWMDGWIDGWVGGWVEKGGSFFTWPCVGGGQPLTPTLCLSSPDGLCLWLAWQFLPLLGILAFLPVVPPHPPASGCFLPSEGFHLYRRSLSIPHSVFCPSIYGGSGVSAAHRLLCRLCFSGGFGNFPCSGRLIKCWGKQRQRLRCCV